MRYGSHVVDSVRADSRAFDEAPDFSFVPHFRAWEGLRLAHIDEGEGPPVIFVHGEPTWSFLWREVIRPVRDAGYRCIAPDLPGFGRSDKPTDIGWYSYDRLCDAVASLLLELDLRDATMVVHDWGGPVGLRLAVEHPHRISRMVILDTGLFTGHQTMTDAWKEFAAFVARTEDLPVGLLVRRACKRDPGARVVAAYEAPFASTPGAKAGARALPLILPTTPEMPGAAAGQRVLEGLRGDRRPKLVLWADSDPVLPLAVGRRFAAALGTEVHHVIADAGHFLQEDAGPEIGTLIARWLTSL